MTTPAAPPKPGHVHAAVKFFEHTIEVAIDEAKLFIRQGLARDVPALQADIAKAEADLEKAAETAVPAPTASGTGTAAPPAGSKPEETK